MAKYLYLIFVCTTLISQILAGNVVPGEPCKSDSQCTTSCCNNDRDFSHFGKCVEIDDDARCADRRDRSRIALLCYLTLFTLLIAVCSVMKSRQIHNEARYLRRIKICAQNEQDKTDARNRTPPKQSVALTLNNTIPGVDRGSMRKSGETDMEEYNRKASQAAFGVGETPGRYSSLIGTAQETDSEPFLYKREEE